jgi:hypothetical protein
MYVRRTVCTYVHTIICTEPARDDEKKVRVSSAKVILRVLTQNRIDLERTLGRLNDWDWLNAWMGAGCVFVLSCSISHAQLLNSKRRHAYIHTLVHSKLPTTEDHRRLHTVSLERDYIEIERLRD